MIRLTQAWRQRDEVLSPTAHTLLRSLARSSAVYVLATMASPLASLVLAPFLTRYLSAADYGLLTVLLAAIGLVAGLTQLGIGSAFFRAYNYDYSSHQDRAAILTTAVGLLFTVALAALVAAVFIARPIATHLLDRPPSANFVILAAAIVMVQNLSVPAFAWMRSEGRAGSFAVLSIINLAVTVSANVVLVGVLRLGVAGSLIATGSGFTAVILTIAPMILRQLAMPRFDVARSMLSFGVPQVPSVLAVWVLQLSDRYLLAQLRSLDETARYTVAYGLGMAVSIVVVSPFAIAWPTAMYAIAKRADAGQQFRLIFTAAFLIFLLLAFALSIVGVLVLDLLFTSHYRSAAAVIPLVSASMAFYGMYILLTIGIGLKRKTWVASALTLAAATLNVLLNLLLIPKFGAFGAANSTLVAYFGLVAAAYFVNQRLYPLDLPIGRLVAAIAIGMLLYAGSYELGQTMGPQFVLPALILGLIAYSGCVVGLGVSSIPPVAHELGLSRKDDPTTDSD